MRILMVGLALAATSVFVVSGARLARSSSVDDEAFAALDSNHDGLVSRDELSAVATSLELFDRLDTDHDGFLTRAELRAARRP